MGTFKLGGYNYWTELLDWTNGLTQTTKTCLIQCRTEAKRTYSLSYFANIVAYSVFPGVSRDVHI